MDTEDDYEIFTGNSLEDLFKFFEESWFYGDYEPTRNQELLTMRKLNQRR